MPRAESGTPHTESGTPHTESGTSGAESGTPRTESVTGIGVAPGNPNISHHDVLYVVSPELRAVYQRFAGDEGGSYR